MYAHRVNRIVEQLFDGAAPRRWCVYPRGTVVLFGENVPAEKLVEKAQLFMRRNGPVQEGSPSGDFFPVGSNNAWVVYFNSPRGVGFFGVLLDSTRGSIAAGFAQRKARAEDSLCLPVCTSTNFVTFVEPSMQIFDPLNTRNDSEDDEDDEDDDDDEEDMGDLTIPELS